MTGAAAVDAAAPEPLVDASGSTTHSGGPGPPSGSPLGLVTWLSPLPSHSVLNDGLTWMSICLSTPSPVFVKACGTPGGTTTSSPAPTSSVSSPSVNVPEPSCTSSSSSYGCVCSEGPRPGGASTMITQTPTPPWSAPTNSCAMLDSGRSATFRTGMAGHLIVGCASV